MAKEKIGVCGIACYKCPAFVKKECLGCRPIEACPLPECAKGKGVEVCFECKDFPCKLNYEKGPIAKEILDYLKDKK